MKPIVLGAGLGLAALLALLTRGASAAAVVGSGSGSGFLKPEQFWNGDVKEIQRKLNSYGNSLTIDGKAGTQTCRAAERAIADGVADSDVRLFAASKWCGFGAPRAACGIDKSLPQASNAVRKEILDAAVAKGYPRGDVEKAVARESGWYPNAVACAQTGTRHAIAGGLIQFIPVALKSVGFDGSPDQFAALSGEQQLPYIKKFIARMPRSVLHLPGDFGLALFTPAHVDKPDDYVIYPVGSLEWEQNPGLRTANNGPITAGKVRATAR